MPQPPPDQFFWKRIVTGGASQGVDIPQRPTDSAGHGSLAALRMVPEPGFEEVVDCGSTWSGNSWATVFYTWGLIAPGQGPGGSNFSGDGPVISTPTLFRPHPTRLGPLCLGVGTLEGMRLASAHVGGQPGFVGCQLETYLTVIPPTWWASSTGALMVLVLL